MEVTHKSKEYGFQMYQNTLDASVAADLLWQGISWRLEKSE